MTGISVEGRVPTLAAGLLTACCTLHLFLLAAGVSALVAAAAGASVVAAGVLAVTAMLWRRTRRRQKPNCLTAGAGPPAGRVQVSDGR